MDLHYSQTPLLLPVKPHQFHYLMDLHYSQTPGSLITEGYKFHYLMDLHYSQTATIINERCISFTTLWIYTILKLAVLLLWRMLVSLPYGFTLFSNKYGYKKSPGPFHYLMDLHYSQTDLGRLCRLHRFHYLMDLHYSQTDCLTFLQLGQFHYLMDLHYSQTMIASSSVGIGFHYLMDLHYSQTSNLK